MPEYRPLSFKLQVRHSMSSGMSSGTLQSAAEAAESVGAFSSLLLSRLLAHHLLISPHILKPNNPGNPDKQTVD